MEVNASADRVAALLAGVEPAWRIEVVESTGSTNADLLAAIRRGTVGPYTALIARRQMAGRGRLERSWETAPGLSLALSAALPLTAPSSHWGLTPLAAGLAVVGAVGSFGVTARLKWPNDVLVDGRKLAGILVEVTGATAVVGIGLNIGQTAETIGASERVSLTMAGASLTLEEVAAAILARLAQAVAEPDLAAYQAHCDTIGRYVRLVRPAGGPIEGTAVAVAVDGELVVDTGAGQFVSFAAGDVYHLR